MLRICCVDDDIVGEKVTMKNTYLSHIIELFGGKKYAKKI